MFNWKYLKRVVTSYLELIVKVTSIHKQEFKYVQT